MVKSMIKKSKRKSPKKNKCTGKKCPVDKICNPSSGRCVKKTGRIGKKLLLKSKAKRKTVRKSKAKRKTVRKSKAKRKTVRKYQVSIYNLLARKYK